MPDGTKITREEATAAAALLQKWCKQNETCVGCPFFDSKAYTECGLDNGIPLGWEYGKEKKKK